MVLWTVAFRHDTYVHTWLTPENFSTHNAFSSIALVYYSESTSTRRMHYYIIIFLRRKVPGQTGA
jgi:hypothetical protein